MDSSSSNLNSYRSYFNIHRHQRSKMIEVDEDSPVDVPVTDYKNEYLKMKKENEVLQREIIQLQKDIEVEKEKGKDDSYKLEHEIEELCDMKYEENDQLANEIKDLKKQIAELEEWEESADEIDEKIRKITKIDKETTAQEALFCDELMSTTKLLRSLSDNQPLSTDEMFRVNTRIPKYKAGTAAAMMSSSLFQLRQTLISLYAKNIMTPGCAVQ